MDGGVLIAPAPRKGSTLLARPGPAPPARRAPSSQRYVPVHPTLHTKRPCAPHAAHKQYQRWPAQARLLLSLALASLDRDSWPRTAATAVATTSTSAAAAATTTTTTATTATTTTPAITKD